MSIVRVDHVDKDYYIGDQTVAALKDITLSVEAGVFMALAGPSGSGKTTLLNLIGCIDVPTRGNIFIRDVDTARKTRDELADIRARMIGFVFQTFNLLPVLSARENVEYPLLQRKDLSKAERQKRIEQFLDVVGLTRYADHRPNQLSGGQRQRVAIARALVIHPTIVLADEPTANLDHETGNSILQLMRNINRRYKTTFIFSTHDPRVMKMADRLIRIEDGSISMLAMRVRKRWLRVRERALPNDARTTGQSDTDESVRGAATPRG